MTVEWMWLGIVSIVCVAILVIVLRDKISSVYITREGAKVHTDDVQNWSKIVDRIERIDSSVAKSTRKATTRLVMLDIEQYNMSIGAVLVNMTANQPLICAAYENHHTRELLPDGGVAYIADKTSDIVEITKDFRKSFPELTDEKCFEHVCNWVKEALIPSLRRGCIEKVGYYEEQIRKGKISKTIKDILAVCLDKNEQYIKCINKLAARLCSNDESTILTPT